MLTMETTLHDIMIYSSSLKNTNLNGMSSIFNLANNKGANDTQITDKIKATIRLTVSLTVSFF